MAIAQCEGSQLLQCILKRDSLLFDKVLREFSKYTEEYTVSNSIVMASIQLESISRD